MRAARSNLFTDVNLTPLVDVMLTVLSLFMITSPLLLAGPEVTLPRASARITPVTDADLVLTVTAEGRVFFRETEVTGRVRAALSADPALQRDGQLYIRGDRNVKFGIVSQAMAEAQAASVRQLNLVVDPESFDTPVSGAR